MSLQIDVQEEEKGLDETLEKKAKELNKLCKLNSLSCGGIPIFESFTSETCIMKESGKVEVLSLDEYRQSLLLTHGTTTKVS